MLDFEQLARGLGAAADEEARLRTAVHGAVELVEGCDHAGVILVSENRKRSTLSLQAASDDVVERAAQWQLDLGEGPCIDAVRDEQTVVSMDLTAERRWPRWAPKVHDELGVCSMVSLLLYTDGSAFGSLNLYGDRGHAFDGSDLATAQAMAGHVAVAMTAGRTIEGLGVSIASRTLIGQAEGILMERFDMDAAQAFAYLQRLSSERETKLAVVAAQIATTRQLPQTPAQRADP